AGGDISAGVMGNMTALSGEKLGLFARTGQLSLKASEGPVEMQAQNGRMQLFAEKKLTLSSASDITFAGKKRITLIGGGSYLRLEAGKVEYGTTAMYIRKVKRTMAAGKIQLKLIYLLLLAKSQIYSPLKKFCSHNQGLNDAYFPSYFITIFPEWHFQRLGFSVHACRYCT
uniref:DUF2345 domain-containing protein n=1 Tax=Enterobacter hormaechei TaxID=158836 RepID=UPI00201390D6